MRRGLVDFVWNVSPPSQLQIASIVSFQSGIRPQYSFYVLVAAASSRHSILA
jgi:hypothetical protein